MDLSSSLISEFVKATNDNSQKSNETTVNGTVVVANGTPYVQLDGSSLLTPVSTTTDIESGERVTVLIKDHTAIVTGNMSSPSARTGDVQEVRAQVANLETLTADKADIAELNAQKAKIENLESSNAKITDTLTAQRADILELKTDKLSAADADIKYANIDFSNIEQAAIEKIFSDSGIIRDLVVSEGKITGELVGVTIKGDIIEGGTIKADKLVVKGSDGLFYKLNTDGVTTTAEQTEYNSLSGTVITAKSITAEKVAVDDLVAFDATIGGFNITESAIYSGVKESATNTTRGVYLDKEGQMSVGDADNFIRYYKDENGDYKLEISVSSLLIKSGGKTSNLATAIDDIKTDVDSLRDEITTLLRIESSRGTVFKNDNVATVLSVVIYHGTQRITDSTAMKSVFGSAAYLQWKWQRLDDKSFGIISSSDSRFGDNGFTFTLSPEDVDTKVTFMCELIV